MAQARAATLIESYSATSYFGHLLGRPFQKGPEMDDLIRKWTSLVIDDHKFRGYL